MAFIKGSAEANNFTVIGQTGVARLNQGGLFAIFFHLDHGGISLGRFGRALGACGREAGGGGDSGISQRARMVPASSARDASAGTRGGSACAATPISGVASSRA